MATNWNDMQAALNTRSSELSGAEETAPSDFTDLGTTSNIDVGGVTSDPQWSVEGTAPQRVDIFEPVVDEPIERWIARPRPAGFEKSYINLDPALDADLISSEGLTYSAPIATWIGYYPGMTSNTQIGKVTEFIVGSSATLTVVGISLAGTAYTPNYRLFGQDSSVRATQFSGTITGVSYSANTITVRATALSRTILPIDPTQTWWLTTTGIVSEPV